MKFYASDIKGKDLFYVEIKKSCTYGNLTETSLPTTIFKLPIVLNLIRKINISLFNSNEMNSTVRLLNYYLKTRKEYISFYFSENELLSNGKHNIDYFNIFNDIIYQQSINYKQAITLINNPYLFRFLCNELSLFEGNKLKTILQKQYEDKLEINFESMCQTTNNSVLIVEYRSIAIRNASNEIQLHIKYQNELPIELYFIPQ